MNTAVKMAERKTIVVDENNEELAGFLDALRTHGELHVSFKGEDIRVYFQKATTAEGKRFLSESGLSDDE